MHEDRVAKPEVGSAAGDGTDDKEGLCAQDHGLGKWSVRGFVGDIFGAGKKAEEGAALEGDVIADGAAEHGVGGFEGVEGGTKSDRAFDVEGDFAADAG